MLWVALLSAALVIVIALIGFLVFRGVPVPAAAPTGAAAGPAAQSPAASVAAPQSTPATPTQAH